MPYALLVAWVVGPRLALLAVAWWTPWVSGAFSHPAVALVAGLLAPWSALLWTLHGASGGAWSQAWLAAALLGALIDLVALLVRAVRLALG